jgi:DNA-directed RNA polymerase subunit M/transcription elongation factor TFIIS
MSKRMAMTPTIKTWKTAKSEKVACPKCDASIKLYRSDQPHIDESGFESYSFKCRACGSTLIGIVDPADDTLLVAISS